MDTLTLKNLSEIFIKNRCPDSRKAWGLEREKLEILHARGNHASHLTAPQYGKLSRWIKKIYGPAMGFGDWFLTRSGLYARGRRNALSVQRVNLELKLKNLPLAFDGYRILHLSDLHMDMIHGLDESIARAVFEISVDLCVMTGDYRSGFSGPFDHIVKGLENIMAGIKTRDGFLATLGNHDEQKMASAFHAIHLPVLANETVTLTRSGETIHLTGIDDVNRFYTPAAEAALSLPDNAFGIALVHSPEMADTAAKAGYGLYLCGHTHGGQICLPGGIPVFVNLKRHARYAKGLWRRDGMTGYTSRGAGLCGLPARFFSKSEITVITLRNTP